MKIAVTGANGFIGRHFLAELQSRAIDVVTVIRPNSVASSELGSTRIVRMDLQDPPANAFEALGCPDIVVHLAWGGLPNYKSLHHFERELGWQYDLLKLLVSTGLKTLVVTGTCFEYGDRPGLLREDFETTPTNPYGFAKDTLRKQLQFLKATLPFNLNWARLFYLYGEGQSATSLFSLFREAVRRGDRVFNMSGGEQLRDFLPVSEAARTLVELAIQQADHGIVNICQGRPTSVRCLVEDWIREFNTPISLNLGHYPYPDYEPFAFWGDRAKLNRLLEVK